MAGHIPRAFIDELLSRCDLAELINEHVTLRKAGQNYVACCPFHNEKSPSFSVSPKQFYHCFGCGVSGNAISFLMDYERLEFVDAIESLASRLGLTVPREVLPHQNQTSDTQHDYQLLYQALGHVAQDYQQQLFSSPQGKKALAYLTQRGIDSNWIKQFGIGFAPAGWNNLQRLMQQHSISQQHLLATGMLIKKENGNTYDRFRERIMFPILDRRGRVIAFGGRTLTDETPKYLNSPETAIFHKGNELYGLYEARRANRDLTQIIVVEGYMDVIALAQYGVTNVVASLGTAATPEHLRRLFRVTSEIIFCFDGDQAGKKAAWRALENLLPLLTDGVQARFMFLPDGEDPDSLIRKQGKKTFNDYLTKATPLSDFMLQQLCAQADISSIDGKAHLANLAKPYINKMPLGVFRQLLLNKLAALLRMSSDKLDTLIEEPKASQAQSKINSQTAPQPARTASPLRMALALLVQNPELISHISGDEPFFQLKIKGLPLFIEIIELLNDSPHLNTGNIIEYWRNKDEEKIIIALTKWGHCIPEERIKDEFIEILNRLNLLCCEQKIERLLQKASLQGLTDTERELLQTLITEKHSKKL